MGRVVAGEGRTRTKRVHTGDELSEASDRRGASALVGVPVSGVQRKR